MEAEEISQTSDALQTENTALRERIKQLEAEVSFLRLHHVFAQGLKGETLIASLTDGELTAFAEKYDVALPGNAKIEVKFSKLNEPVPGRPVRRWNWSKPLGWKDKGKLYDILVLVGEKDPRYSEQYPDDAPYVFFLVPRSRVPDVCCTGNTIGAMVQLTTNPASTTAPTAAVLWSLMRPEAAVAALVHDATPG